MCLPFCFVFFQIDLNQRYFTRVNRDRRKPAMRQCICPVLFVERVTDTDWRRVGVYKNNNTNKKTQLVFVA